MTAPGQHPGPGRPTVDPDPDRPSSLPDGLTQQIGGHPHARLEDALSMFRAGESLDVVADEYGIPREHLEDVVRIATRVAA